jgi:peptidoglycan/LPS O-acetylase OafA/YrhL
VTELAASPAGTGRGPGNRFVAGDPLRGIAALGVFFFHVAAGAVILTGSAHLLVAAPGSPGGYLDTYGVVLGSAIVTGPGGVLFFFMLSGYLIGRPFTRALIEGRPLPSVRDYARNRVLRVVPTYWFVLTAVVVIFVLLAREGSVKLSELGEMYLFQVPVDNALASWLAQAWTLTVEAKFYVALPIAAAVAAPLIRRLPTRRARALAIVLPCMAWFAIAPFVYVGLPPGHGSFLFFLRVLTAGVAVAAIEPLIRPLVAENTRLARIATPAMAFALAYLFAAGALYELGAPFVAGTGRLLLDIAILALLVVPLIRQWAGGSSWRTIDNPVTRWFGTRSYPFYLVHLAVLWLIGRELAQAGYDYWEASAVLATAGLAASAVLAEILHRTVERPFMERKGRSTQATVDAPAPPTVAGTPAASLPTRSSS